MTMNNEINIYKKISELTPKKRDSLTSDYSEIIQLKNIASKVDELKDCLIRHTHPQNSQFFDSRTDSFREIIRELLQKVWSGFCNFDDQLQKHNYLKVADDNTLLFKSLDDLYNEKIRKRGK